MKQDIAVAMDPDALIDSEVVSQLAGVSVWTIRKWEREGRLPKAIRMTRRLRWPANVIRAWLKDQASAS